MSDQTEKLETIKKKLETDIVACDAKLSIFISAAVSFKRDFLIIPFPHSYISDGIKDFDQLVSL